ncbi:DNA topoisomerase IV subunit A [Mycoplasma leonicaptivi]|uniref:DNA topoisomerase IV subunit A n=1 Tax=Mycoplasma leonicaptivi TaxID=36742 RepID=UPI000485C8DD|nr:DNA topoisomerase IV subunit A [Mycoplasma leonicaptivi]
MKKTKEILIENIINESLENIMSDRFSKYSKYVIQQRALPDIRDGLKPVQRRILYSMLTLGLDFDKSYKKSARVVGDVIGKYHPHGDSSVYEAMVNMSQWWKQGIPLLDMHGNIGSMDNDSPAAMRYTEVRLSKFSQFILGDLKKKTVPFIPNFDDSETEPLILPSLLPNILVNGSRGIAIGMATDMPPHNLGEVIDATILRIKKPNASLNEVMKHVKGPDFPTGGEIHGTNGILEAFETGTNKKNKIKLFSVYTTYEKGNNSFIEITQIPYGVTKSKLVYDIDLLIQNKEIDGIIEIKDQSDRNGVNILITLEKNVNINSIISFLMQKTDLQITYNYNNTVISNLQPKTVNLIELLDSYQNHVKDIVNKTLQYDLEKAKLRLEIVEGFIKVSEITDAVIKVIRESENSKSGVIQNLIKHFNFTLIQATAIAELRLYKLSKTDKQAYLDEKGQLEQDIKRMILLLNDASEFDKYIIKKLQELKNEFNIPRRTKIIESEFDFSYSETDLIKDEQLTVGISKNGYVKKFSDKIVEANNIKNYQLKEEDNLVFYSKLSSLSTLLIFTSLGNFIVLPIYKINNSKWKELGQHLSDIIDWEYNEQIISIFEIKDWNQNIFVVLGTEKGYFKKTKLSDFKMTKINKKYSCINISDDDRVVNALLSNGEKNIYIITKNGLGSMYSEIDVPIYGLKTKGVKGVYLSLNDKVAQFVMCELNQKIVVSSNNGYVNKIECNKITYIPKNIKGKKTFALPNETIINDIAIYNSDTIFIVKQSNSETTLEPIANISFTKNDIKANKILLPEITNVNIIKNDTEEKVAIQNMFSQEFIKDEEEIFKLSQQTLTEAENKLESLLKKLSKQNK